MSFISHTQILCILIFFFFFFFYVNCSSPTSSKTKQLCHPKQKFALLQFKNSTSVSSAPNPYCNDNSSRRTTSWTESTDCCSWDGVTCDELTGNVMDLDLQCVWLQGSIQENSSLFELPHLQSLNLDHNKFSGKLPSSLFASPSLLSLNLQDNNFTGPIDQFSLPSKSLTVLRLVSNRLHGPIPSSIYELSNLTVLDISSNNLSGTVKFDMLSKLRNLEILDLSNNSRLSFSSSTNNTYSLPKLKGLNFHHCNVRDFPSFLRTSEKLQWLYLSSNKIHGGITKFKSEGWKSLRYLDVSNIFLTFIEDHPWKSIFYLQLQNNTIQGVIPIPPPSTQFFLASYNRFSGQIPPSICNLSSLAYLAMSHNNLTGKIPPCLGNLNLMLLHLRDNNLQGGIPDKIANGSWLWSLDLSNNNLEGPLPRSLINYSDLVAINVGSNMIRDTFPCWLGTLPKVKLLVLRSNRFHGPICDSKTISMFPKLQIMDLSDNELTGFLPRRIFSSMQAMTNRDGDEPGKLYMGQAYFSAYSESLVARTKGLELELNKVSSFFKFIDLSRNRFQGEIPEVLGDFKGLKSLNLSHNTLTGKIPLSLGNLTELESLDLSFNILDGRIPEQLKSITALEVLSLSYNRLWGRIPKGNQFDTFDCDSFIGNKNLCGEPLPVKCGDYGIGKTNSFASISREDDGTASGFDWKIVMMGYGSGVVLGLSMGYIVFSTEKPKWFCKDGRRRSVQKN